MTDLEKLARAFHDAYERLAPSFGYETRKDTREFDPDSANGKLMMAVCGEVAVSLAEAGRIEGLQEAEGIAGVKADHWHSKAAEAFDANEYKSNKKSRELAIKSDGAEDVEQAIRARIQELQGK